VTFAIAAAGTGGHVYPALSLARALEDLGVPKTEIAFLGGDRFEAEAVPGAGYSFRAFPLARLRSWSSLRNLTIPLVVRRGAASMTDHLRERGAKVVVGMGGYVSVPASIAARRAGVPFFLQEQNATPGRASRFAARRAVATFLGLPGESERLPRSTVVGNPLRPELATADRYALRSDARRRYGLGGSGRVLGILGGSLGARVLNDAAPALVAGSGAVGIVHLTGAGAHAAMVQLASDAAVPWTCRPFEAEMQYFYAAADLVVCRAGAMTVSELAATGTPSVLVPLERVGQGWNARTLAEVGGALVISQAEAGKLPDVVRGLLADSVELDRMGERARQVGRPDAAVAIARHLVEAAGA
jgi:UDP-N-acetylglucosamine--N-acetylmuramyl-(pentapeptide) pyrophosphoryl-undecaprenol N-acetylglucosamine transferase